MAELANPRRRLVLSTFAAAKSPIRILGVSERQLGEMGDEFENVEHRTFGKEGLRMRSSRSRKSNRPWALPILRNSRHPRQPRPDATVGGQHDRVMAPHPDPLPAGGARGACFSSLAPLAGRGLG